MRLIFLFALLSAFSLSAQDSSAVKKPDSLQNKSIQITPYYSHDVMTSGNYIATINDSALFQFSAGISVFNVLRGRTPSLVIPSYAPSATAEIRSDFLGNFNSNTIVLDGMPVSNSILTYQNMNAFEFSSISVVGNNNALMFLDTRGSGAMLLTSKSGENVKKPTFEFNSYATQSQLDVGINAGGIHTDKDTYWSNALAYSQDFGVMDMRVSYNLLTHTDAEINLPSLHNLKLNLGAKINGKLDFRLILNDQFSKDDYTTSSPQYTFKNELTKNSFYGNMTMRYKPFEWLHFSSQLVYSNDNSDSIFVFTKNPLKLYERSRHGNNQVFNLFTNLQRRMGGFNISGFAGIQYAKQEALLASLGIDTIVLFDYKNERFLTAPFVSMGMTLRFQKLASLSATYRQNRYEEIENVKRGSSYSINSSFVFSELLEWKFLSLGKIRANIGSNSERPIPSYPLGNFNNKYLNDLDVNMNSEVGGDLFFFKSTLGLSISYFKRENNYESQYTSVFKELHSKGWEASILFAPVQPRKLQYKLGIILSTFSTQSKGWYDNDILYPYSTADWKVNFSGVVSFKTLHFNFIVERINAHFYVGNNPTITKLRDVSLGYQLPLAVVSQFGLQKASMSISGRNLLASLKSGSDYEDNYSYQKSFSVGLNVIF